MSVYKYLLAISLLFCLVSCEDIVIDLYDVDELAAECIKMPEEYKSEYHFPEDSMTFISQDAKNIYLTKKGELYVEPTEWVWYGNEKTKIEGPQVIFGEVFFSHTITEGTSKIRVLDGPDIYTATVNVHNYNKMYADEVIDKFIKEELKDGMTDLEKLNIIAGFTTDYKLVQQGYDTYPEMVTCQKGIGKAISIVIKTICDRAGLTTHYRYAGYEMDFGITQRHQNVAAKIGNEIYIVEAGYLSEPPRKYRVWKSEAGYTFDHSATGIIIKLYDGFEENVVVPDTIMDLPILTIFKNSFQNSAKYSGIKYKSIKLPDSVTSIGESAFADLDSLTEINIPKNVESIGEGAFTGCKLLKINVDSENKFFASKDGALYDKDLTTLIYSA